MALCSDGITLELLARSSIFKPPEGRPVTVFGGIIFGWVLYSLINIKLLLHNPNSDVPMAVVHKFASECCRLR